jgi:uncharacterized membrane-anchored protein YjiN (DUF445 family)
MRLLATLLLVAMAGVFALATLYQASLPWLSYVRAFAEASLVGGLADWFAVTALFRRPLGLPIPHTAIIPNNKDRIGDSLARFLKDNFLTPRVVARRLETFDVAGAAARWLAAPREASRSGGRRRRGLSKLLARLIEALDHATLGSILKDVATARLTRMEASSVLASIIDAAIADGRHEPVVDAAIRWAATTLDAQESMIRDMVHDRTAWLLRLASIDDRVADSIIDALRNLVNEIAADPAHPLRVRITEALRDYAFDLRHFPEAQAKVEQLKADLLANPQLSDWLDGLWNSARAALLRLLTDPASAGAGQLETAAISLGRTLEADAALRAVLNLHLRRAVVGLVSDYGDAIVTLVSDTIRSWDAVTVTDKFENAVGRDLQYIRINGTVIGGLVGLTIHALSAAG